MRILSLLLIPPILPLERPDADMAMDGNTAVAIMSVLLAIGISFVLSYILLRVMREKGFPANRYAVPISGCTVGLLLFLRFGWTETWVQGVFLFFVLLYASLSDILDHSMDDFLWVQILALSLLSIRTVGIGAMLFAGLFVLIPQVSMAVFPSHRTLGGADIKLSVATAVLLGGIRGIGAYLFGLVLAVICMTLYTRKTNRCPKTSFALVPFLSIGTMIAFFL